MIFLEDPTPIIVCGILIEAVLAVVFVQTRRAGVLYAMGGVLAVVLIGLVVERLVVTEQKRIKATLYGAAKAIERNDPAGLGSFVAKSAATLLQRATGYMGMVEFTSVSISDLKIDKPNMLTSPPTVQIAFFATAHFNGRRGDFPYNAYPSQFWATLVLEDGQWKIQSVEDKNLNPLGQDVRP
jgi:hypothetical protein